MQHKEDWPECLGGKERDLYSSLGQINCQNVSQLEVAWTYETGNAAEYQANNLIVNGMLFTPTQTRKVIALNAAPSLNETVMFPGFDGGMERGGGGPIPRGYTTSMSARCRGFCK